jgi:hypothetical protein
MFGDKSAALARGRCRIFNRHIPAVEFHHLGTHLAMNAVQRCLANGRGFGMFWQEAKSPGTLPVVSGKLEACDYRAQY